MEQFLCGILVKTERFFLCDLVRTEEIAVFLRALHCSVMADLPHKHCFLPSQDKSDSLKLFGLGPDTFKIMFCPSRDTS